MDSPIELPDGRLVCRRHGLHVCGSCCVDYTFMDEVLAESDEAPDLLSHQRSSAEHAQPGPGYFRRIDPVIDVQPLAMQDQGCIRGNGRVYPSKFVPPSPASTPDELFPAGMGRRASPHVYRFLRHNNPDELLIFTDGACFANGGSNPRAGWAFVFKPPTARDLGTTSGRLESCGPWGDYHEQTNNRAELRAVLAALRFRYWPGEGFTKLVIATDSEYVAKGATEWVLGWIRNGWRTSSRAGVKNRDLWEALLGEFSRLEEVGLKVEFWRIPRSLNAVADQAAKEAAMDEGVDYYRDVMGALV
ncbi:hypothetical protein N0V84_011686 [Fusarium piperis]|uniref:ribonuclease H n=1 Tax=Fusarium piperis TaxID=1435070 RepID=A0A9W8TAQ2_9HYPO|nr:hypothetical protein N0V84_011686 [Fusarium piperis]